MQALRRIRPLTPQETAGKPDRELPPLDSETRPGARALLLAPRHRPRPGGRRGAAGPARRQFRAGDNHSLGRGTSAASLAGALVLVAAFGLGGCSPGDDDEAYVGAPGDGETAVQVGEVREIQTPSIPSQGFATYDADRLERERLDESWRLYAETDRTARSSRPRPAPAPGATARDDQDQDAAPAGANPPRNQAAGRSRSGPATPDDSTAGTSAPGATVPANRLETKPVKRPIDDGGLNSTLARLRVGSARPKPAAPPTASAASRPGKASESWQDITPERLREGELAFPISRQGGGPTAFRTQWLLDRARFSPGILDGRWGKNTEKAVYWLQDSLGLEPTGEVGPDLYRRLAEAVGDEQPVRRYEVTQEDLAGPFTTIPDDPAGQAALDCLCYASAKEALAERFHTTVDLLAHLNPDADLDALTAGTQLWVPNVEVMEPGDAGDGKAIERIVISKGGFYLHAFDGDGNLVYHFPSTLGSDYDPSFAEPIKVVGLAWSPDFHYQPKLFDDVPDSDEEHMLPPGPNSPVGLVWMQLSKENYGIHGTAAPETIGYATSHGCVRLTNWDAIFLGHHVRGGVEVEFRE